MEIEKKVYRSDRLVGDEDYQDISVELECDTGRGFVVAELTTMKRWRSIDDTAAYLRWAADEIEKIQVIDCPFL